MRILCKIFGHKWKQKANVREAQEGDKRVCVHCQLQESAIMYFDVHWYCPTCRCSESMNGGCRVDNPPSPSTCCGKPMINEWDHIRARWLEKQQRENNNP